ncbi:hypothetical protein SPSIL_021890 [Sporomusa silvacetica DSM 10669]|uniref:Uncharacterized protein n=1 Tax=Sporomusa silvacetica DSM 10669 TaxID=1123289 RepID=A0ABZ3IK28_9FIRM|nr:hypothetical protein [Sporomusa silvacetica]OZC17614.1 hypothetical protein SPSIL_31840 [Sporomusa silvacetica DSM 10669]
MDRKHPDRTSEWRKQQQILKEYSNKKSATKDTDDIDKKHS